jgi:hypothetical protein
MGGSSLWLVRVMSLCGSGRAIARYPGPRIRTRVPEFQAIGVRYERIGRGCGCCGFALVFAG